jgi:peptide/nickel transport system permease protein
MLEFIFKRLFYGLLVLFGIVTVVFVLFNLLPGDPARMMLGQRADEESIRIINKDLGLDLPLITQFGLYLNDLSPVSIHETKNETHHLYLSDEKYKSYIPLIHIGSKILILKAPYLRRSYQTKRYVTDIVAKALPQTALLAFVAMIIATFLGIILGIIAAIKKDSLIDRFSLFIATLGMSLPSFFAAILIGWVLAYLLAPYTGLNMTGSLYTLDDFGEGYLFTPKNIILPAVTLGIRPLSIIMQLTRNSLLDVLSQDYIRTAKAKGLNQFVVILKHALRNALNPVLTAVSGWLASLMSGSVFVEMVFAWKGIGLVLVNSLNEYDLPVLMGCVLIFSCIFVVINILVDILYGILDPRIRMSNV